MKRTPYCLPLTFLFLTVICSPVSAEVKSSPAKNGVPSGP